MQLCEAIKYLHSNNIIHKDIKPQNILYDNVDRIYLADFGIVKNPDTNLTEKSDRLANFDYHAPEQKVSSKQTVTTTADIYALGLILNQCFTKQIIQGDNFAKIIDEKPLYAGLDDLVNKMIEYDSNNRFDIDTVIIKLKSFKLELNKVLSDIKKYITPIKYKKSNIFIIKQVVKDACEDIFTANKLCKQERYYNSNWHYKNNISYKASKPLERLVCKENILEIVKNKFEYEGNVDISEYKPLDLDKPNNKKLLDDLKELLSYYNINKDYKYYNLIIKYFCSCADYHCREILECIENLKEKYKNPIYDNINAAPIMWIINYAKKFNNIKQYIKNDENFVIDYIEIDWEYTVAKFELQKFMYERKNDIKTRNIYDIKKININKHFKIKNNYNKYYVVDEQDEYSDKLQYIEPNFKQSIVNIKKIKEKLKTEYNIDINIDTVIKDNKHIIYLSKNNYKKLNSILTKLARENLESKENTKENNPHIEADTRHLLQIREDYNNYNIIVLEWDYFFGINNILKTLLCI